MNLTGIRLRYQVTRDENKAWYKRLHVVNKLAEWVFINLDMSKREAIESDARRKAKAYQYVYEHFAVGKLFHPVEHRDPLFTYGVVEDESMINMLKPGQYPEFQVQYRILLREFEGFVPDDGTRPVTMQDVDTNLDSAAKAKISLFREQLKRDYKGLSRAWYDDQLIGLIIRYNCIGGFSDNLHASVSNTWSEELPDFVECFASPFNHKFETYFSVFEKDKLFGSQGSFFVMIHEQGGILPSGKYEINPPWNNQMYDEMVTILDRSMPTNDIQAIIVGPNWEDATWCNQGFNNLIQSCHEYTENSFKNVNVIGYVNDATSRPLYLKTAYWVISKAPMNESVLSKLSLFNPKKRQDAIHD